MTTYHDITVRCLPLFLACFAALSMHGQDETPLTRLFDTGATSAQPLADEAVAKRVGWTLVPEDNVAHPFSGDAVLLNDKLAVVLRKQGRGAEVYSRTASGLKHRASVGHIGASAAMTTGRSAGLQPALAERGLSQPAAGTPSGRPRIESKDALRLETSHAPGALRIVENNSSAVMVEATAKDKASAALSFRLTTGEAILEIRSGDGAEAVSVQSKTRYVVVPDFFGDDVVFETGAHLGGRSYTTPTSSVENGERVTRPSEVFAERVSAGRVRGKFLPAENFCLSLLDGGEAMMMSVWQSSEQDVWLDPSPALNGTLSPSDGERAGVRGNASPKSEDSTSLNVGCLKGKSIWLAFLESPGLWHAGSASAKGDWKPPFPAKWRCSLVRENGVADSWITEKPDGTNPQRSADFRPLPPRQPTVKRTEVRAPNAPFLVYPIDRSAATPLTVTCPTDVMRNTLGVGPCQYILACEGLAAQGDPTPNAVMNWVEKQFEQKKERKAADDIKERLQVMTEHVAHARARIQSYGEFASQMHKLLANKPGSEPFRPIVDDMDRFVTVGVAPTASPERARQLAGEVSALIGQPNALAACQRLGEQLRAIGAVQDGTLARCRMAVRRLRQEARTIAANQPHGSGVTQEVQRLAGQMLHKK